MTANENDYLLRPSSKTWMLCVGLATFDSAILTAQLLEVLSVKNAGRISSSNGLEGGSISGVTNPDRKDDYTSGSSCVCRILSRAKSSRKHQTEERLSIHW